MEKVIHNIKSEIKLISMLGCTLNGPDNSNHWLILDENNNQVGFIQYKKLFKKNNKKGRPAIYGYHTEINTSDIIYNSTRKVGNENDITNIDNRFNYKLDIKRKDDNIDQLEINVGKCPGLTLWSEEYGFINFKLDNDGLHLDFKSKTENFNVEETIVYQIHNRQFSNLPNEYAYQLCYCDKSIEIDNDNSKGIKSHQIVGTSKPYQQDSNEIKVVETTWVDDKLRKKRESFVKGTIEEMIVKHKMGIDSFNHFRFLINQILPFKEEIISSMLDYYNKEELALFIPELGLSEEMVEQSNYNHQKQLDLKKL